MKKSLGKLILNVSILMLFVACDNKQKENLNDQTHYYESIDKSVYVLKNGEDVTVFCNPMDIGKYGCSIFFGGKLSNGKFSKGYFLEKSNKENQVFDTIYSDDKKYVNFKLENKKLLINLKTDNVGCNVLFHDSFEGHSIKSDTIELNTINDKLKGIAIPKGFIKAKSVSSKIIEDENRPMLILEDSKDSLKVIFRKESHSDKYSKIIKETGKISKIDCSIVK